MQHHFDVDIAKEYGIIEAILLDNIDHWLRVNEANERNFHDGSYWTYNSTRAFAELFPYASQRQIQNALKHLKDEGIIKTGRYNAMPYDRTLWYAFTEKGETIMRKCKMEDAKKGNEFPPQGKPIPDINQMNKPVVETNTKKERKQSPGMGYEVIIDSSVSNEDVKESLREFIKMRKLIKSPMTDRALRRLITKLKNLSSDSMVQVAILDQSIVNNWKDVYPLKQDNTSRYNNRDTRQTYAPRNDEEWPEIEGF